MNYWNEIQDSKLPNYSMFIPLVHLFYFAFFNLYVRHCLSLDITRYRFHNLTG